MSFLNREGSRFWQQQTEFLQATRRALIDMDTAYLDPALLKERFDPFAENYVDFQVIEVFGDSSIRSFNGIPRHGKPCCLIVV